MHGRADGVYPGVGAARENLALILVYKADSSDGFGHPQTA